MNEDEKKALRKLAEALGLVTDATKNASKAVEALTKEIIRFTRLQGGFASGVPGGGAIGLSAPE